MAAFYLANLRGLRRIFRLESRRLQLLQGVRAVLAISVPIGLGLVLQQLAAAVIVTLGAWFVLITDTGGAYRQKAAATLSATIGVACAVLAASILNISPVSRILGTFLWVAVAAFVGVFGNSAATVSFSTSLMFVITAALPHAGAIWFRVILSLAGGIWAASLSLALWPLHAFTPVIQAVGRCYETLADLLEAACSVQDEVAGDEPSTNDPFPNRFEAMHVSLETGRKIWTAVRVQRAGWSPRSSQLLALIENAAQLSSAAVALHQQMRLVRAHPRFAEVSGEMAHEKIELVQVTQSMATAIVQRGGNVELRDLERADARLEEAIERLRSATYTEIQDFSILVHIRKVSRCFRSLLDLLRASAEIVGNFSTGRSAESIRPPSGPQKERRSTRILPILGSNLTF
jgi:FUSC-like inner membrane protein yccS